MVMRPCGACRALVGEGGCEHWTPTARPARVQRPPTDRVWLGQALGGRQHDLLADASRASDGCVRSLGDRAVSVAGHRLAGRGLVERMAEKGTYRITDAGREALKRLESMQHKLEG